MKPASPDVHFAEPWLSIRWDEAHRCIYATWTGLADSVEFRSGTMEILKAIRARKAACLVSDNRELAAVANQDQIWINESWVPLAVGSGLRRIAVVLAPQGQAKVASEGIISRFGDNVFETRTFSSPDDALAWVADSSDA
jgi:hypothetical protein